MIVLQERRRRTGLRFSLRVLLAAVTLSASGLGYWRAYVRPYRVQSEAIQIVLDAGGTVQTRPAGPAWLRRLWGEDRIITVVEVDLENCAVTDECLAWLLRLPDLERFKVGRRIPGQISAPMYAESLRSAEYLNLTGSRITDEGLESLLECERLETLFLNSTQVTDDGARRLRRLKSLRILWLADTGVSVHTVRELREVLPNTYVGY